MTFNFEGSSYLGLGLISQVLLRAVQIGSSRYFPYVAQICFFSLFSKYVGQPRYFPYVAQICFVPLFSMLLRYVFFRFFRNVLVSLPRYFPYVARYVFFSLFSECVGQPASVFSVCCSDMFCSAFFLKSEICWSACLGIFRMLFRYVFFAFFEMYWSAVFSMFFAFKKKRNMYLLVVSCAMICIHQRAALD